MNAVSDAEVERLALSHGAFIIRRINACDLERPEVSWIQLGIKLTNANALTTSSRAGESAPSTESID
jgi:hypothetical protein